MLPAIVGTGIVSEIIIIAIIAAVIFIILKLGKALFKLVFGIIINSVLGVIVLLLFNYFFALGIVISLGLIIPIAIFGLPAAGTVILLKLLGVVL
jgi:riboflavin transporter FmnP